MRIFSATSSFYSLLTGGVFFLVLVAFTSEIHAAQCFPGHVAPGGGTVVPANFPAIGLQVAYHEGAMGLPFEVTLFEENGEEILLTERECSMEYFPHTELVPEVPLETGKTYRLEYEDPCQEFDYSEDDENVVTINRFEVVEESPLPQVFGSIRAEDLGVGEVCPNQYGCVDCCLLAHVVRIHVEPSKSLVPFLPTTKFCLHKDDEFFDCDNFDGSIDYGLEKAPGNERYFDLYQPCPESIQNLPEICENHYFPEEPNTYEIFVSGHVAGMNDALISDSLQVTLSNCEELQMDSFDGSSNGGIIHANSSNGSCAFVQKTSGICLGIVLYLFAWRRRILHRS